MSLSHSILAENVSRETYNNTSLAFDEYQTQFELYADKLIWWNKKVNLLSRNTTKKEVMQHIRHSLYMNTFIEQGVRHIVDAGSGGGLPGIPLGIINQERKVTLVDVVQKKMMAVDAIRRDLGLKNIKCVHNSIEKIVVQENSVLVSKHAFKLNNLLELTQRSQYSHMVLLKGADYIEELKEVKRHLHITALDISAVEADAFFDGKHILIIKPQRNE